MLSKFLCITMAFAGFSLGSWGIYESSRTVEMKVKSEKNRRILGDKEEWSTIIANAAGRQEKIDELRKFIEEQEKNELSVEFLSLLEKKCKGIGKTNRWSLNYSKNYESFKNFCTLET